MVPLSARSSQKEVALLLAIVGWSVGTPVSSPVTPGTPDMRGTSVGRHVGRSGQNVPTSTSASYLVIKTVVLAQT